MKKILILFMLLLPVLCFAQGLGDYLILQDIGVYIFRPKRVITIQNAGTLVPTGHFPGHGDMTYEGIYIHPQTYLGVEVQVTQHAGADSDRWLLHEVDAEFRNYYGMPGEVYGPRQINGQIILEAMAGGGNYRWLSGNKVIMIEYHDAQLTKHEPVEIIQAYLAKHPSTLQSFSLAQLRNVDNEIKWIKDEMDRRLWLCDKWFEKKQTGKVDVDTLLKEIHDHMKVFLNYKEKYYGIASTDEKNAIYGYMQAKDETAMKNKLTEYKTWWAGNRDKKIRL